jgi:hypothetical protein
MGRIREMRAKRIALGVAISACAIVAPGAAHAQEYRGTLEQQMACTPDVWRLCSDQVPDVNRIVACLRLNTPQLSNGCRAVFDSGSASPPPAPRGGRTIQPRPAPPPGAVQPQPYEDYDD